VAGEDGAHTHAEGADGEHLVVLVVVALAHRRHGPSSSDDLDHGAGAAALGGPGRCWRRPTTSRLPPFRRVCLARGSAPQTGGVWGLIFDVYAPLSIAAVVSASLVGVELGHGARRAVAELEPLIGIAQ
jgi:hypothetical protein